MVIYVILLLSANHLVLDAALKKISDPIKREALAEEEKRHKEWEQFHKEHQKQHDEFQKMFEEMLNTIGCACCGGRHKRTLIKDRNFYSARYCGECNNNHPAKDGEVWAEANIFGLTWICYVCMDGEVGKVNLFYGIPSFIYLFV